MAVLAAAMSGREDDTDGHGQDVVMPGFRFHPTEEELVEFYLRRKVEGKRFNVELITFLDLYRYDPWDLPTMATIGEKEWFFYVPRDRKYRNGDRPNRVTTSGYWKATGADRMIRTDSSRPIGLKKTLVFYSGKAPKGVRTSWIMNEYRLPQSERDWHHKAEISLCRVYKRAGVADPHRLLHCGLSSRPTSSRLTATNMKQSVCHQPTANFNSALAGDSSPSEVEKMHEAGGITCHDAGVVPVLPMRAAYGATSSLVPLSSTPDEDGTVLHSKDISPLVPTCTFLGSSSNSMQVASANEFNRIVGYHQNYLTQTNQLFNPLASQSQMLPLMTTVPSSLPTLASKLWEGNPIPEAERSCNIFKYI